MFGSATMPGVLPSLFWGIVTLSIVVFVHEGGHYLAARLCGLHVSEFMIGLPGPKLSWQWGKTRYGITAIPFGGYVRIPALEGSGPNAELGLMTDAELEVYDSIPMWKRVVTLIAGIIMNLLLAIVILTLVMSLWGRQVDRGFVDPVPGGPAQVAGLAAGDKILSIDGVAVADFEQLVAVVAKRQVGESVQIRYVRYGAESSLNVTLGARPDDEAAAGATGATGTGAGTAPAAYMGVMIHPVVERMPVGAALGQSFRFIALTAQGIARLFTPSTFRSTVDQSSSVIGISVVAAQAARTGVMEYATLVAVISLSLGLMNLLPIPPLDGGKIVLELVQKVTGRPINRKLLVGLSVLGFALMIFLMVFVMFNDVIKLLK